MADAIIKEYATFNSDFPNEIIWSESGDILVPAGQEVAEALSSALSRNGFDCSAVEQHSYYGWDFEINAGPRFLCIVQFFKTWLFICDIQRSLKDRLLRKRYPQEYQDILEAINTVLQADERINSVKWFTPEEFENLIA